MHAGLINVSSEDALFFWMVQTPQADPPKSLLIWMNGGPGCSSMDGLFMEYIYLGGESYAGVYVPYYSKAILDGTFTGLGKYNLKVQGLLLGNPLLEPVFQSLSFVPFALKHNIITASQASRLQPEVDACAVAGKQNKVPKLVVPECAKVLRSVLDSTKQTLGSCVNMYDVRLRDATPDLGCGLYGWPDALEGMRRYLSRRDVRRAVHVLVGDEDEWIECNGAVASGFDGGQDTEAPAHVGGFFVKKLILMTVDLVCNVDGLRTVLTHLPNNNTHLLFSIAVTSGRLTHVIIHGASHMVGVGKGQETKDMFRRFIEGEGRWDVEVTVGVGENVREEVEDDEERRFGGPPFGRVRMAEKVRGGGEVVEEVKDDVLELVDEGAERRESLVNRVNAFGHRDWL
ncbi:Alpha/Beta hydrolase protein [Chytridium lagenaria]|nr:Alpha/Beta hydrolase protein [Chytridium lagenaria]